MMDSNSIPMHPTGTTTTSADFSRDFKDVVVKSGSEEYNDHDYYQEDYVEENEEEGNGLRRQLKGRHISVSFRLSFWLPAHVETNVLPERRLW